MGTTLRLFVMQRKNKVRVSQPSLYLEAAFSKNNMEHLAALIRFFSENRHIFKILRISRKTRNRAGIMETDSGILERS
jgi:hypothetical protein